MGSYNVFLFAALYMLALPLPVVACNLSSLTITSTTQEGLITHPMASSITTAIEIAEDTAAFNRPEAKEKAAYRIYDENTPEHVKKFYLENHTKQTYATALEKREKFLALNRTTMSIWEAIDWLDMVVDQSDPDIDLPQHYHLFQTAEALRKAGKPRWLILTGFIHDLGKILTLYNEPQWAIVGDTFPLGCPFAKEIVFSEFFKENPDNEVAAFQSPSGIYEPNCGFDNVIMSWGHDEYLYHVVKDYLPKEALYIIRYHSFYAAHHEGAYSYLMNDFDREMMPLLRLFSSYDLYSKSPEKLDLEALMPYYVDLVAEFFPAKLAW